MLGQDTIFADELHTVNPRLSKGCLQDSKEDTHDRTTAGKLETPRYASERDRTIRPKALDPTGKTSGLTRQRDEDTHSRLLVWKRVRPDGIEDAKHMRLA